MKKLLLITLALALGIIFFPSETKAQYSPYVYNGGAYLNYALASQRARRMRGRHSTHKSKKRVSSRKRRTYKKRHASLMENITKPELLILDLPKKNVIV